MGWQVNPEISEIEILDVLSSSSYTDKNGAKLIHPQNFIDAIKVYNVD